MSKRKVVPDKSVKQEAAPPEKPEETGDELKAKQAERREENQDYDLPPTKETQREQEDFFVEEPTPDKSPYQQEINNAQYEKRRESNKAQYEKRRESNKAQYEKRREENQDYDLHPTRETQRESMATYVQRKAQAPFKEQYQPQRGQAGRDGQDGQDSHALTNKSETPLQRSEPGGNNSIVQELKTQTEVLRQIASKEEIG